MRQFVAACAKVKHAYLRNVVNSYDLQKARFVLKEIFGTVSEP
jgi:hypothetical protein